GAKFTTPPTRPPASVREFHLNGPATSGSPRKAPRYAGFRSGHRECSAGRGGGQLGEHRGLPLERLLMAVEGIAVGELTGIEVAHVCPIVVLPDQHSKW